jgi:hypothetical protein
VQNKKNKELKQNLVTWREDDKICELEINELIVKKKGGATIQKTLFIMLSTKTLTKKYYLSSLPSKP